jgi:hypothetical protein
MTRKNSTDRHSYRHALQHATGHYPAAHRHIVEGKGKRAEGGVKDTEQERFLPHSSDAARLSGNRRAALGP